MSTEPSRASHPGPATSPHDATPATERTSPPHNSPLLYAGLGVAIVLILGATVRYLEQGVPEWTEGTALAEFGAAIEFPIYAIIIGLLGNAILSLLGVRDRITGGFRTEFFIKTGLVLLGASINLSVIVNAAGPAMAQAVLLVSAVFLFTWWLAGKLGVDAKLRALLSSAVSICGVSAAITAAAAVQAKREQLAYTASLVIVFALPSIFVLPALVDLFGLDPAVAGAWIGGNIDTTAAVTAAGALVGEEALQIASIVKVTQNAFMGLVAVALTAYFAFRVERSDASARPRAIELWHRFPKFVLGFVAASIIATVYLSYADPDAGAETIGVVDALRTWFFIFAFVSIGLELKVTLLREAGWRPVVVFAGATVFNLVIGLGIASVLFAGFEF